jgi:hypothetical protein
MQHILLCLIDALSEAIPKWIARLQPSLLLLQIVIRTGFL